MEFEIITHVFDADGSVMDSTSRGASSDDEDVEGLVL